MPHHHIRDQWVSWQVYYNRHRHVLLCTLQFSVWYIAEAAVGGESKASGQAWSTMAAEQIFSHLFTTFWWRLCFFLCHFGRKAVKYGALPTIFSFAPATKQRKMPKSRSKSAENARSPSIATAASLTECDIDASQNSDIDCSVCSDVSFVLHEKPSESAKIQWSFEAEARAEVRNARKRLVRLKGKACWCGNLTA